MRPIDVIFLHKLETAQKSRLFDRVTIYETEVPCSLEPRVQLILKSLTSLFTAAAAAAYDALASVMFFTISQIQFS